MKYIPKFLIVAFLLIGNSSIAQEVLTEDFKVLPDFFLSATDKYFGFSVSNDGDFAVVGEPFYNNGTGRVYLYHYNGSLWERIALLTASDGNEGDRFGMTVRISGNTIVIGTYKVNQLKGSAYVFEIPPDNWTDMTEIAKLSASDIEPDDYFGCSVSIDNSTIIVGASNEYAYLFEKPVQGWEDMTQTAVLYVAASNTNYPWGSVDISDEVVVVSSDEAEAVYIFEKPKNGWVDMVHTAKLSLPKNSYSFSGTSVAISKDLIAIGIHNHNSYLYQKPKNGWSDDLITDKYILNLGSSSFERSIDVDNGVVIVESSDGFSVFEKLSSGITKTASYPINSKVLTEYHPVSISGNHILTGEPSNHEMGTRSGVVYSFAKPVSGWAKISKNQKILPELYPNNRYANFGYSVSSYGEYTVIGAPGLNLCGSAYIFKYNGISWEKIAVLKPSDGIMGVDFGKSVSIYDKTIVVGAPYSKINDLDNCGAVYVFQMPSSGWTDMTQTAKLTTDCGKNECVGLSVSASNNTIVIGSVSSIYLFEKQSDRWTDMTTQTAKLTPTNGRGIDPMQGISVSIWDDVVVGGYFIDVKQPEPGADPFQSIANIFEKPINGWENMPETATLAASDNMEGNYFSKVKIYDDLIVAGVSGAAYVFEKPINGWADNTQTARLTPADKIDSMRFGHSLDVYEDQIVIGNSYYNKMGCAYFYSKPDNGWADSALTKNIISSDISNEDDFGKSVSIYDKRITVGAYLNDDNFKSSGSAYFYKISDEKVTAVPEIKNASIYPIPAKNFLNIDGLDVYPATAKIYDLNGKLLGNYIIENQSPIDISHLKTGLYILNLEQNGKVIKQKFIKAIN